MRSDQRALRLEVKKQIIKYLDSDLFFLSWFGLEWSVLNRPWPAKAQSQLKLWINVHYMSGFYSRTRKHYISYHKISYFPDVTFLFVKKYGVNVFYFNSKFQTRRFFTWKYLGIQTSVFRVGLTVQSLSGNWTATKTFFFNFSEKSPLPLSWFKKIIVYYRSEAIRWQIKSPLLICGFDFFFFLKPTRKRRAQGKAVRVIPEPVEIT